MVGGLIFSGSPQKLFFKNGDALSMSETIHVTYCLDDGYAEYTCVSMASMLANTKSNVHFHIISNRLSDENKAKLSSLSGHFPHMLLSFNEFTFDSDGFETGDSYITTEAYYRLYLPEILPNLERILYLDGDTVINGDISKLWNIDLGKHTVGVVVDQWTRQFTAERNKAIGFNDDDLYFNSGVLLINVKNFGRYLFTQQISTVVPELYKKIKDVNGSWCLDQELLNYVFNADKSALFLPLQYNFMDPNVSNYNTELLFRRGCYELKDWALAYSNPVIIHYNGLKPFPFDGNFKFSHHWRLYYKYKALTPFYDPLDEKRIVEYDRRELLTKTESLIPTSLYIPWFWRDIFVHSVKYVKQIIGERKLAFWGGAGRHITLLMAIFASERLYPDAIVDGLTANHGKNVFGYTIQPADILRGKTEEYFVVLCMETKPARDAVVKLLKEYGYDENGFTHAYAEAYERENKSLNVFN